MRDNPSKPCATLTARRRGFSRRGFSLIEVMAVLLIIGLIVGLVGINVRGRLTQAKVNAAKAEIGVICEALEHFYTTYNRYPTNEEGIAILSQSTDLLPEPLLDAAPVDPWNHAYVYNQPGRDGLPYEVLSLGRDGLEGGDRADADINHASLERREGAS